jgi:hypothetical protein
MDGEQVLMMSHQTVQEFAQKSAQFDLKEYEMLMYEATCNLLASFAKLQRSSFELQTLQLEQKLIVEKKNHEKWMKENDSEEPSSE